MGRRKIEIKAIKDDRNRSVTFLKRKGGLFKKAHELSVLCSVDVAVIIFGHNKKLYEFSSGDINEMIGRYSYYGGPHERKGPADFQGKDNDEEDEEPDDAAIEEQLNEQQNAPYIHHPQAHPHMRPRASASPPNTNGLLPHHYRQHTPQPPHPGSRPVSRNHNPISRPNSTLGHHPSHPANGYPYMAGPPHNGHPMQGQHHPSQFPSQFQQHPQHFQGHQQMQFLPPDQRRPSMPPYAAQQQVSQQHVERLAPQATMKVERHSPSPPQVQEPVRVQSDSLHPQPIRAMGSKSKSIFTPIDAGGSSIAASWGFASMREDPKSHETISANKTASPEPRSKSNPQSQPLAGRPQFAPPQRTDSMSSIGGGSKRPRLNLQIPSEQSDDDAGPSGTTASPHPSGDTGPSTTQTKGSEATNTSHSGVILPPPSPSTLLSASANGPPNPFARPLPPNAANSNNSTGFSGSNNNNIETPISALPSRFLNEGMLPSPSSFYPEWGFTRSGGGDGNMLPSPLTFPTPVQGPGSGSAFNTGSRDTGGSGSAGDATGEGGSDRKRKTPEAETPGGANAMPSRAGKKVKADS